MKTREVFRRIRKAERTRTGMNCTRWYSSVHPKRNGEADVKTWAVKTFKGKLVILLASVYPTDGSQPKISGRCLRSMYDNCHHWNWLDYGGKTHIAVWEDVDGCRDEMLDFDHTFGKGLEFFGLGTFVNGFEHTKYQYGCFFDSGLRVSDWTDCMRISPKTELVIKSGLKRWLDPRYLPTLLDNVPLLNHIRKNAERLQYTSPYFVIRDYVRNFGGVNDERGRAYKIVEKFGFASLPYSPVRILHWLNKTKVKPDQLRHHIDNIKELGMDITYEPHILPKDFAVYSLAIEERVREHREAERLAKEAALQEEIAIARKARIYARRQIRQWLAEGKIGPRFNIVIPNTQTEFATEGHAMHNCVCTYYDNWRLGKTELAFIRKDNKPYMDVEFRNGKIIQARYYKNETVVDGTKDYAICQMAVKAFDKVAA